MVRQRASTALLLPLGGRGRKRMLRCTYRGEFMAVRWLRCIYRGALMAVHL